MEENKCLHENDSFDEADNIREIMGIKRCNARNVNLLT